MHFFVKLSLFSQYRFVLFVKKKSYAKHFVKKVLLMIVLIEKVQN